MTPQTITDLMAHLSDLGFETTNIKLVASYELYNILSEEKWVDEAYPFGLTVVTEFGNLHVIPPKNRKLIREFYER